MFNLVDMLLACKTLTSAWTTIPEAQSTERVWTISKVEGAYKIRVDSLRVLVLDGSWKLGAAMGNVVLTHQSYGTQIWLPLALCGTSTLLREILVSHATCDPIVVDGERRCRYRALHLEDGHGTELSCAHEYAENVVLIASLYQCGWKEVAEHLREHYPNAMG